MNDVCRNVFGVFLLVLATLSYFVTWRAFLAKRPRKWRVVYMVRTERDGLLCGEALVTCSRPNDEVLDRVREVARGFCTPEHKIQNVCVLNVYEVAE